MNLIDFVFRANVPRGSNAVSARWIFTRKVDKIGCVINPIARIVAGGWSVAHHR